MIDQSNNKKILIALAITLIVHIFFIFSIFIMDHSPIKPIAKKAAKVLLGAPKTKIIQSPKNTVIPITPPSTSLPQSTQKATQTKAKDQKQSPPTQAITKKSDVKKIEKEKITKQTTKEKIDKKEPTKDIKNIQQQK